MFQLNPAAWAALGVLALFAWQNRAKLKSLYDLWQASRAQPQAKQVYVDNTQLPLAESPDVQGRFPQLTVEELEDCLLKFRYMGAQLTDATNAEVVGACNTLKSGITAFADTTEQ